MSTASKARPRLVVSAGEPAGIGPELCLWLATQSFDAEITVLADRDALAARAQSSALIAGQSIEFLDGPAKQAQQAGQLAVIHHALASECEPGQLNTANAAQVLSLLDTAMLGCANGQFDALVTAPLQKSVINDAGISFSGHTEYLADFFQAQTVMMLTAGSLRVALATTHLPLAEVPLAITKVGLTEHLSILHSELQRKFGLSQPRILVAGLNPHAGESGHLGREEIEVIEPVLKHLRAQGMNLIGPLPADTLFLPKYLAEADAVFAMYHDQGLPVLKHAGFGEAVNITLGLPIIRTSVDHGTALDLVNSPKIDSGSMKAAILSAIQQCHSKVAEA